METATRKSNKNLEKGKKQMLRKRKKTAAGRQTDVKENE